jgi:aminopeptidase N
MKLSLSPGRRAIIAAATLSVFGVATLASGTAAFAQAQPGPAAPEAQQNPFLPPNAKVFYAPDRDYDLLHVAVNLVIDYPKRAFDGEVTNTLTPLRADGLTNLRFNCGAALIIKSVSVDGKTATYKRDGEWLTVNAPSHVAMGQECKVTIVYRSENQQGTGFAGGSGGLHWINGTATQPDHVGFWTQGETSGNRLWVPTWDYPNDFATTETTTTVPIEWTVIGNGLKVSDKEDKKAGTRTVHWKMDMPHATYLLSVLAGPLEMKTDKWEGRPLLYVVPKGRANTIDFSFGYTPDMLTFYSQLVGVKYAWPKYAQDAMYDFGGGMENVSATTLGQNSLQDPRGNQQSIVSLTSHELGHQWFGDLVTCNDWGQIWLNESFATFMQFCYFEHRYGKNTYDREIASNSRSYFNEARRYERPVVTNLYPDPDSLFDRTAYPKGGVILHTLRRQLGDSAFFAGLNRYLTKHYDSPGTTADLAEAITQASGINVQPFFDQWLYKPGHPVLAWSWSFDDAGKNVVVKVTQTQDTKNGTPIYKLPITFGFITPSGQLIRVKTEMKDADATFLFPAGAKPSAVLLDPDHDFLRDIPDLGWTPDELPVIVQYAPNGIDRTNALRHMLTDTPPSDDLIALAGKVVAADSDADVSFDNIQSLIGLKRESLRPVFRGLLTHPNASRRAEGIRGLGGLSKDPADEKTLQAIVADKTVPYVVARAATTVLGDWDPQANADLLQKAAGPDSPEQIRAVALIALAKANPATTVPTLIKAADSSNPDAVRVAALNAMGSVSATDAPTRDTLLQVLKSEPARSRFLAGAALAALVQRHDQAALPALKEMLAGITNDRAKRGYQDAIRSIESDSAPVAASAAGGGDE